MAIKLNQDAVDHAMKLIKSGEVEVGKQWDWKEHKPDENEIIRFLDTHYTKGEYGQWFLGVNTEIGADNKDRYLFPYGDLQIVHRNGVAQALAEAREKGYQDIATAAEELLNTIDKEIH